MKSLSKYFERHGPDKLVGLVSPKDVYERAVSYFSKDRNTEVEILNTRTYDFTVHFNYKCDLCVCFNGNKCHYSLCRHTDTLCDFEDINISDVNWFDVFEVTSLLRDAITVKSQTINNLRKRLHIVKPNDLYTAREISKYQEQIEDLQKLFNTLQ
jgi:hypothetical protein